MSRGCAGILGSEQVVSRPGPLVRVRAIFVAEWLNWVLNGFRATCSWRGGEIRVRALENGMVVLECGIGSQSILPVGDRNIGVRADFWWAIG